MSDDEGLADQVLDLFVYAPIGLALEARELIPKLADRGRGQIALTRLAGRMASQRGQGEARRVIDQVVDAVGTVLAGEAGDPPVDDETLVDLANSDLVEQLDLTPLPIDDYDDLTAPELLPFLSSLTEEELHTVLRYEQAHRSRATVINRVRQLQS
ncbi:MAG: hypothetical protein RIB98_10390 [Acidimicrobiales bacterium]